MTAKLVDGDGNTLATGLTEEEAKRLQSEGVTVRAENGEYGGDSGSNGGLEPDEIADDLDPEDGGGEQSDSDDDGGESQGNAGGNPLSDLDEDKLSELEEWDENRESGDKWGASDYDTPSAGIQRKYDELQKEDDLELDRRKRARDAARDAKPQSDRDTAEDVKATVHQEGLDRDIEDAFSRIKSRGVKKPDWDRGALNEDKVADVINGIPTAGPMREYRKPAEPGDRVIGVALDLSASMDPNDPTREGDLKRAKVALAALAKACEAIGDELVCVGYTGYMANPDAWRRKHGEDSPNGPIPDEIDEIEDDWDRMDHARTPLVIGPDETFSYDKLDGANAEGGTPMATGMQATYRHMDRCGNGDKVMIVLTDGRPNMGLEAPDDAPEDAENDVIDLVNRYRSDDVTVIGLGVGDGVDTDVMSKLFDSPHAPEGWLHVDNENLVETLVDIYKRQMKTI